MNQKDADAADPERQDLSRHSVGFKASFNVIHACPGNQLEQDFDEDGSVPIDPKWSEEQNCDLLPSLAERLDKRQSILRVFQGQP